MQQVQALLLSLKSNQVQQVQAFFVASVLWREGGGGFAMHFGLVVERMISRCPPTGTSSETNLVYDSDLICRWTCAVAPCLDWLAEVLLFFVVTASRSAAPVPSGFTVELSHVCFRFGRGAVPPVGLGSRE